MKSLSVAPQSICRNTANFLWAFAVIACFASAVPGLRATEADSSGPASAAVAVSAETKLAAPYDLGEGLGYVRVQRVADALPLLDLLNRTQSKGSALVIDLRYTIARDGDAPALALALAQRTGPAPLLVLVSPATPPVLAPAFTNLRPPAITLGVAESRPTPAVIVDQPEDADRRAYDALESGLPLEALITGKIEKERFDEAELVKEFENGNANAAPPPEPDPTQKPATEKAPVLTDRVLQRAVHLHRALLALKRN